jgi:hypothetical protein
MKIYRQNVMKFMAAFSILMVSSPLHSDDHETHHRRLYHKLYEWKEYKPFKPQQIPHTMHRAGHPDQISSRASNAKPGSVIGYPVGGGVAFGKGHGPMLDEGTWGWDSTGTTLLPRSVWLGFSHRKKYQGGTGSYATDKAGKK